MNEAHENLPSKDLEKPTAFLAFPFGPDTINDKSRGENLISALVASGLDVTCLVQEEGWGEHPSSHPIEEAFERIKKADILFIDASGETGFGMGAEAGYAKALKKPVIMMCPEKVQLKPTREDIADTVIRFGEQNDLISKLTTFVQGFKKIGGKTI